MMCIDAAVQALDGWLIRRAWNNQVSGASRIDVVSAAGAVVGYYCLASGALALREASWRIRRNMPDPIPMSMLGHLAVDHAWHGRGVALLRDAVERTQAASIILGIRGVLVHGLMEPVSVLTIDLAPVSDLDHNHDKAIVANLIDDAVIADAKPI